MEYRGFIIEVTKENEGYTLFCYRNHDEWILIDEWNLSLKNSKEAIEDCKITIDDYYTDPSAFEDENFYTLLK